MSKWKTDMCASKMNDDDDDGASSCNKPKRAIFKKKERIIWLYESMIACYHYKHS